MIFDRHTLALVSLAGSALDVLGALYLAYDLLGGEHGPLRVLTRVVTYGVMFGLGYGVPFGAVFGLVCGITHGFTIALELSRASKHAPQPGFWYDTLMSAIRGAGFAIGAAYLYGATFGAAFGVLSVVGQVAAYHVGIRPTMDYHPGRRPRITWRQFLAALNRTVGYGLAGYLAALVSHQREHALSVGLTTGLVVGVVTALFSTCTSFVEWMADHLPERSMGVFGVGLILIGFSLQSIQYWAALFDWSVR